MEIKRSIVRDVCYREHDKDEMERYPDWELMYAEITGNDTDDGGASYEAVMKHVPTGDFYMTDYNDWDFYWEFSDWKENDEEDGDGRTIDDGTTETLTRVYPKTVTKVTYTTKKQA